MALDQRALLVAERRFAVEQFAGEGELAGLDEDAAEDDRAEHGAVLYAVCRGEGDCVDGGLGGANGRIGVGLERGADDGEPARGVEGEAGDVRGDRAERARAGCADGTGEHGRGFGEEQPIERPRAVCGVDAGVGGECGQAAAQIAEQRVEVARGDEDGARGGRHRDIVGGVEEHERRRATALEDRGGHGQTPRGRAPGGIEGDDVARLHEVMFGVKAGLPYPRRGIRAGVIHSAFRDAYGRGAYPGALC